MRHEFVAGNAYAMSGGTLDHQRVAGNFIYQCRNQLSGKTYFPTGSDFKLNVPLGGGEEAFYYPDAMIVCKPVPGDALYTDSPSVILEVLSPTTRRIDEAQKFRDYITIPSLQTYILAETDGAFLTVHRREGDGFRMEIIQGTDAVLISVGVSQISRRLKSAIHHPGPAISCSPSDSLDGLSSHFEEEMP